jgi:hypothetical protein
VSARPPRVWLALALLCVTTLVAYAPSFLVPFQFDDWARIGNNQALVEGRLWDALTWFGNTRLLPSLTLWGDYQLYADEPLGYHVANLTLHLIASCGVFALGIALCATPRLTGRYSPGAIVMLASAAALVFALHPVQVEAVTYIIQRATVMSAAFYLWAVVAYIRARLRPADGRGWLARYAIPLLLGLGAVLSKENAVTLPLMLLMVEWICFGRPRARLLIQAALVVGLLAVSVLALKAVLFNPPRPGGLPSYTFSQRMYLVLISYGTGGPMTATPPATVYALTQATVVPRYLALVARPWGLNVDPHIPLQRQVSPAVVLGALLVFAVASAAAAAVRRAPLVAVGAWWFLIALSVESSVLPLADAMAERRLYLAMPGAALVLGAGFAALRQRLPRSALGLGAVVLLVLSALTFARNVVWQSQLTLWRDAADKSPGKARPWANLGGAYFVEGRLDAAVDAYCRALALAPDDEVIRENLELALTDLGRFDPLEGTPVKQPDGSVLYELPDVATFCPGQK